VRPAKNGGEGMSENKLNCWEFIKCERQPGGLLAEERGVCPASIDTTHDGKNGGKNAGRYCWKVAGTLCEGNEGKILGSFAAMIKNCGSCCHFYQKVKREEGRNYIL
jgi:hypothetical protein